MALANLRRFITSSKRMSMGPAGRGCVWLKSFDCISALQGLFEHVELLV